MIIPNIPTTYYDCSTKTEEVFSGKEKNIKSNKNDLISGTVENLSFGSKEAGTERDLIDLKEKTSSSLFENKEETTSDVVSFKSLEKNNNDVSYTQNYLKHNFSIIITELTELMSKWINSNDTSNSIGEISQIKTILEENEVYLEKTPESRLLLGGLEAIFENDRWEKLNKKQLEVIFKQLEQFKTGNIKIDSLKNFSREIFSAEII